MFRRKTFLLFFLPWLAVAACDAGLLEQERRLLADLEDGRLDRYSLLQAIVLIDGQDAEFLANAIDRLELVARPTTKLPSRERAEALVTRLHDEIFVGQYARDANRVSESLMSGNYNCVSATCLYWIVAQMAGMHPQAVLQPGHMRCRVWDVESDTWIEIEPTLPNGRPPAVEETELPTRPLTPVQVLAKLYYNRAVELMDEGAYPTALRCANFAFQLDEAHAAARENVAVIQNNWSLQLCASKRYERALQIIDQGLILLPNHPLLLQNELHIYLCWLRDLMESGDRKQLNRQLHAALARHPDSPLLQDISRLFPG